jgi:arsenite-transporting ATPase
VRHLLGRRVLFFGGKGGVGKTTCSAALALAASREGKRVLLVSTDPAHSTSDILETRIGPAGREILPNLHALEIDPEDAVRRYVDEAKARLSGLFSPAVVRAAARQIELASSMPGAADAALFDRMTDILIGQAAPYDLVVFDTAPTGHAIRLLRVPELMSTWFEALARRRREATQAEDAARGIGAGLPGREGRRPAATGQGGAEAQARDPVLEILEARAARLAAAREMLARADRVGFVLVLIPERLPIEETARAAHQLEESGMAIAGLVVNRVLPARADGTYFEARKKQERSYLDEIGRRFAAVPRVVVPQLESDVHGLEALGEVSRHLLDDSPGGREW